MFTDIFSSICKMYIVEYIVLETDRMKVLNKNKKKKCVK